VKAAQFQYHAPTTTREAVELLREHADDAKALAGGQSLVPMLALRLARFDHLVDLNRISELRGISLDGDQLVVGSLTRQSVAEHSDLVAQHVPLLTRALPKIGHFQIRNRGTIGGSIAHADPASELPATALCLDATITLTGPGGTREVAAKDFFISVWQSAAEPDEIVTSIGFPITTAGSGYAIEEFALRTGDFAIAGVTCVIRLDASQNIHHAAISYMGMGPTPLRARIAEEALLGTPVSTVNIEDIAQQAISETAPGDDVHASASYRTRVATQLTIDALGKAIEEASRE
jgi:carbon-monoxide dehydrogenase medium subunit